MVLREMFQVRAGAKLALHLKMDMAGPMKVLEVEIHMAPTMVELEVEIHMAPTMVVLEVKIYIVPAAIVLEVKIYTAPNIIVLEAEICVTMGMIRLWRVLRKIICWIRVTKALVLMMVMGTENMGLMTRGIPLEGLLDPGLLDQEMDRKGLMHDALTVMGMVIISRNALNLVVDAVALNTKLTHVPMHVNAHSVQGTY